MSNRSTNLHVIWVVLALFSMLATHDWWFRHTERARSKVCVTLFVYCTPGIWLTEILLTIADSMAREGFGPYVSKRNVRHSIRSLYGIRLFSRFTSISDSPPCPLHSDSTYFFNTGDIVCAQAHVRTTPDGYSDQAWNPSFYRDLDLSPEKQDTVIRLAVVIEGIHWPCLGLLKSLVFAPSFYQHEQFSPSPSPAKGSNDAESLLAVFWFIWLHLSSVNEVSLLPRQGPASCMMLNTTDVVSRRHIICPLDDTWYVWYIHTS